MENKNNKVVLAFSGGLDTSFCAIYLQKERNLEVHAVIVNTGGFSDQELADIEQKAKSYNVASFQCIDATEVFYEKCIKYLIFGNVLRNQTYPLSVSAERLFQAKAIAQYAQQIDAAYVAHGSTGAGNDQVRFDLAFELYCPDATIITPIRDLKLSRKAEIEFLEKHGVTLEWEKAKYSVNKGLWGTSVGGAETLGSSAPLPNNAFPSQLEQTEPKEISLDFQSGELVGIDGTKYESSKNALEALNVLTSSYAIGRDIHVGDTIIGIKGRVGFEAGAALLSIKAHQLLEKHTLTKWQQYWKDQLGNWYGMFLHESQMNEPVMRNIESFLESTQSNVTGQVFVKLVPYHFELCGIESAFDLMQSEFGQYGEMNELWSGEDVKGFTKVLSNSLKIHKSLNPEYHD